jgi:type IV secretory pathway TraG/TraD family ATPase VirD4
MEAEFAVTRSAIAKSEYEAFLNNSSPNFRFGVVSGLLARLALFANPKIAAATEVTDFSVDELVNQRFTMYLAVPVHRTDYLPLSALAFNFIFTFAMSKLEELKYPLNLYLDEFTNYGAIPGIARYLTVIRNAGVGAVLGVQDLAQLEYVYKDKLAQIIWSQPRTKVLFPPADDRMAERISKMLGTETQQEIVSASGHLSNRQFPRPLIDAAELLKLEKEGKYLVVSNTNPVKVSRMKSWEDYPSTTRLPVPVIDVLKVDDCQEDSPPSARSQKQEETARERGCKGASSDTEGAKANKGHSDVQEEDVSGVEPIPSGEEPSFATESPEGPSPIEDKSESSGGPAGGPEGRDREEGEEGYFWSNLRGKYK